MENRRKLEKNFFCLADLIIYFIELKCKTPFHYFIGFHSEYYLSNLKCQQNLNPSEAERRKSIARPPY